MTTLIPALQPKTIARIALLAREIWEEHYGPIIGQKKIDYMLGRFQSVDAIQKQITHEQAHYYLIQHHDQDVGYFALLPNTPSSGAVFLSKIYIHQQVRGKGFGKIALDFAATWSRLIGGETLWLTVNKNNHDSIAWYLRQGFINEGSLVTDIGDGHVMDDYKMVLPLTSSTDPSTTL